MRVWNAVSAEETDSSLIFIKAIAGFLLSTTYFRSCISRGHPLNIETGTYTLRQLTATSDILVVIYAIYFIKSRGLVV